MELPKTREFLRQKLVKSATELDHMIVDASPIKSGQAIASIMVSDGAADPHMVEVNQDDPSKYLTRQAASSMAKSRTSRLTGKLWKIVISLNVPYARRLEHGWSWRQAPNGMFRVSLAKWLAGKR